MAANSVSAQLVQRIANDGLSLGDRLQAAVQWKSLGPEGLAQGGDLGNWPQAHLAPCLHVLRTLNPKFEDDDQHKIRHIVLDMLSRLPAAEALRPYMGQVFEAGMVVVKTDNHENAYLAVKIIFELIKGFKGVMEQQAGQFMELIIQMFRDAPSVARSLLESDTLTAAAANNTAPPAPVSTQGIRSIKLLQELAIPTMFMMQMYGKLAAMFVEPLVTAMYEVLCISVPTSELPAGLHPGWAGLVADLRLVQVKALQFIAHILRQKQGQVLKVPPQGLAEATIRLLKTCPDTTSHRKEVVVAVKHLLGSAAKEALRAHLDVLLDPSMTLLLGRPGSAARSAPGFETLKWQAYHILAELIHYSRKALTPSQLAKATHLLAHMVLATQIAPVPGHTRLSLLRILFTLLESCSTIAKSPALDGTAKIPVRNLGTRLLEILVTMAKSISGQVHQILADVKTERQQLSEQRKQIINTGLNANLPGPNEVIKSTGADAASLTGHHKPAGSAVELRQGSQPPTDGNNGGGGNGAGHGEGNGNMLVSVPTANGHLSTNEEDHMQVDEKPNKVQLTQESAWGTGAPGHKGEPVFLSLLPTPGDKERELAEAKQAILQIMNHLKQLIYLLSHFTRTHQAAASGGAPGAMPLAAVPPLPAGLPQGFFEDELRLMSKCWLYLLRCLPLLWHEADAKEACLRFVDAFGQIEGKDFVEIIYPRLGAFFTALLDDVELLLVVTQLSSLQGTPSQGRVFVYHMLCHMLAPTRLQQLERMQSKQGQVALKLIKVLLAALPNMTDLESTFAPLLAKCVEHCCTAAASAEQPLGYLQLLRSCFKTALHQGSRPRLLQAEMEPHLNACLQLFTAMLAGPNSSELRPLLVELCLTMPTSLDHLQLYVARMVQPLALALTQGPEELQLLGLRSLEVWIDHVPLDTLEAALSPMVAEVMGALWALLRPGNPLAARTLLTLGKLGGRNRRWLRDPLRLEYKDNPEYGLRLILTFQPTMSFLTPLDKCMALAKASMLSPAPLGDGAHDLHYRQQALRFLQVSLASVMALRSCDEPADQPNQPNSAGPGGAQAAGQDASAAGSSEPTGSGQAAAGGTAAEEPAAVDRLLEVLLGAGPVPSVPPVPTKMDQGVKTKTQLLAERSVLVTLLSGVIAAAAEDRLGESATQFAHDVCRHFAMLFAAGTQPPPPAPAMYRPSQSNAAGPSNGPAGASAVASMTPHGLRELDIHLFLDALLDVLTDKVARRAVAALDGMDIFLDTLLMLREAKANLQSKATANGAEGSAAMEVDTVAGQDKADGKPSEPVQGTDGDKALENGPSKERAASQAADTGLYGPGIATSLGLPSVLDVLYSRLMHCCTDDTWQSRLAGAAAIRLMVHQPRIPPVYLQHWAAPTVRALLGVVRRLPPHSVVETSEVAATLTVFLEKTLLGEQPPPLKHKDKTSKSHQTASHSSHHGDATAAANDSAVVLNTNSTAGADASAGPSKQTIAPVVADFQKPDPSADWLKAVTDVLLSCITNPNSTTRMRATAASAVHLLASSTDTTASALTTAFMAASTKEDIRDITSRRLLPLKSLSASMGTAEAIDYCCRLNPPVVTWGAPLAVIMEDAMTIMESDEQTLVQQLPRAAPLPPQALTQLKVSCMNLICGVMQLEGFRDLELKVDDSSLPPPGTTPGGSVAAAAATPGAQANGSATAASAAAQQAGAATADGQAPADAATAGGSTAGGSGSGAGNTPEAEPVKPRGDPVLKRRLTLLLLNALATPNAAISNSAKCAVESLLAAQAKVSKVTLQHGLRPLLQNLGDHKKLTIPMLEGLSRLLETLSEWFSVSLGSKLLEHLQKWTTPEGPAAAGKPGPVAWRQGEEAQVAAHMLDLFHLLPRQAVQFLETSPEATRLGLVVLVIELEDKSQNLGAVVPLPHVAVSPYRAPLTNFLNKYATEAAAYFLDPIRIVSDKYVNRLLDILRGQQPSSCAMLSALMAAGDKLVPLLAIGCSTANHTGSTPPPAAQVAEAAPFNAVHLVSHISKLVPGWLKDQPDLVSALRARWGSPERLARLAAEPNLPRAQLLESKRLAKALLAYVDSKRDDVTPLFDLLSILSTYTMVSFDFLLKYCKSVATTWSDSEIKGLMKSMVAAWVSGNYSQEHLERLMQVLINPVLLACCEAGRGYSVLDMELADGMARHLLGLTPPNKDKDEAAGNKDVSDSTLVELLQLTSCILEHTPKMFETHYHKQLITWVWRHLRRENPTVVSYALLTTSNYLTVNKSPEHVVQQVLTSMLRGNVQHQGELKRPIVRQALDHMIQPVLIDQHYIVLPGQADGGAIPRWVRIMKRMAEDTSPGNGSAGPLALWQLLLKQAPALYPYRNFFSNSIHAAALRLASHQGQNATELRRMGLDLVAVMIGWEEKSAAALAAGGDADAAPTTSGPRAGSKRPREDGSVDDTAAASGSALKTQRTEDGVAVPAASSLEPSPSVANSMQVSEGGASTVAREGSSTQQSQQGVLVGPEWHPHPSVQDQTCTLLLRFVLNLHPPTADGKDAAGGAGGRDGGKDEEAALLQQAALALLSRIVKVWPQANIKLGYLERILQQSMQQAVVQAQAAQNAAVAQHGQIPPPVPQAAPCVNPPPSLTAGLQLLRVVLDVGSPHLLRVAHSQVHAAMEAAGQTKSWTCVCDVAQIVRAVLSWPQPPPQPDAPAAPLPEVQVVIHNLDKVVKKHIQQATQEVPPGAEGAVPTLSTHPQVLSQLCCCIAVLEEVASLLPPNMLQELIQLLIRTLFVVGKEVNSQALAAINAVQAAVAAGRRGVTIPMSAPDGPEYGTVNWAFAHCLHLLAPFVLVSQDLKKPVLTTLVNTLVGPHSKGLDPILVKHILHVVHRWALDPYPGQQGQLNQKELILLCQRLGMVAALEPYNKARVDVVYLNLIQKLCTSDAVPQETRSEVFAKVERAFMLGLRNTHPNLRRQFLQLYHTSVPATLYDRLHFIICGLDWEQMSTQFWLKHALDMLLALLREEDDILLAFNSSQVAPLLPGTKQNIYSPQMHMLHARGASGANTQQHANASQGNAPDAPKAEVKVEPRPDGPAAGSGGAPAIKMESGANEGTTGVTNQPMKMEVDEPQPAQQPSQQLPVTGSQASGGASSAPTAAGGPGGSGTGAGAVPSVPWHPTVRKEAVSQDVLDLISRHSDFLKSSGALRVRDMMLAAREYLHADTHMAYHLWVLMFPIVWATLEKAQQVTLAKPLITLLSKECHHRQAMVRPNVIQALLDGIAVCQPQPKIPPELIKFLGRTHNAWQIAVPLLESHCVMFPQDTRCFDALGQLYHLVSEDDMLCGLWRKRANSEVTKTALWLVQTGQLDAAEELLGGSTRLTMSHNLPVMLPRGEAALWVDQWVHVSKALNQWDALGEYARTTDQVELSAEASWRQNDWQWLKDCLTTSRAAIDDPGPAMLTRCYLSIQENDFGSADARLSQASLQFIFKWWQLPDVGSAPQQALLQGFQQLVELRESLRLLMNLNQPMEQFPPGVQPWQDVKEIMAVWRQRIPNEWESPVHWQEVMVWRMYVYNMVIKAFANMAETNPQMHQLGYRDKAWAVNKLGSVATGHGLPDSCLWIINNMYGYSAMEVQEAFAKIREQGQAYLQKPTDTMAGVNLISGTNLDYFQLHHQSDIFRLKGALLAQLSDQEGAHAAFSTALHLCKTSAEAWVSWSQLCDSQFEASMQNNPNPALLEYSVHCMLQGLRLGSAAARALIPRLLCQLSFDNDPNPAHLPPGQHANFSNVVGGVMARSGAYELPPWIWLGWLPQLLMSLSRPEVQAVKPLLQLLAVHAPQALFYPLRVHCVSLREGVTRVYQEVKQRQSVVQHAQANLQAAQAKFNAAQQAEAAAANGDGTSDAAASALAAAKATLSQAQRDLTQHTNMLHTLEIARAAEYTAFETGRDLTELLRSKWTSLQGCLEVLVTELASRFSSRQEERLLAVVAALLHRCYKVPFASQAEVPIMMKKELAGVCKACFTDQANAAAAAANQSSNNPQQASTASGLTTTASVASQGGAPSGAAANATPTAGAAAGSAAGNAAAGSAANTNSRWRRSPLATVLRDQFVLDLNPDSPTFPSTLGDLMDHLKLWKARLTSELEDRIPSTLRLEEEAPTLSDLALTGVHMPGTYAALLGGAEPPPGLLSCIGGPFVPGDPGCVLLESIGSAVHIIRRAGNGHRRIALHGSDGITRHALLQQNCAWPQHCADERIMQLLRAFNRLLDAQPPSRSRALAWYTPALTPLHTSVRLMEEEPSFTTYGEAYDINCARYGREADIPIVHFKKRCADPATGALINDGEKGPQLRLLAFKEICDKLVTENVFSQYVYKTLPSCNHLWVFKKTFCMQQALSGLLCHLLFLGGRAPPKILFAKDTGRVHQLELLTMYSDKGALDRAETVPFRLTRNMVTFFTSFGVEGMYLAALVNAAAAITHKNSNTAPLLSLFFRDDITTWSSRRNTKAVMSQMLKPDILRNLVKLNTSKAGDRLRAMAPAQLNVEEVLGPLLQGQLRCPVSVGAMRLVEAAMDPGNLSRMEATWHPWF